MLWTQDTVVKQSFWFTPRKIDMEPIITPWMFQNVNLQGCTVYWPPFCCCFFLHLQTFCLSILDWLIENSIEYAWHIWITYALDVSMTFNFQSFTTCWFSRWFVYCISRNVNDDLKLHLQCFPPNLHTRASCIKNQDQYSTNKWVCFDFISTWRQGDKVSFSNIW